MNAPATIDVEIGKAYPFYCEMQQEYEPAEKRLRRYTGTSVTVLREETDHDPETGTAYVARTWDGAEITVNAEEINGWDYALDQFFWVDGTYGKQHRSDFLSNERER